MPGYYWADCRARIIPSLSRIHSATDNDSKRFSCVALGVLNDCGAEACQEFRSGDCKSGKWHRDSAATFRMNGLNE